MHPTAAGAPPIPRRVLWFLVAEAVSAIGSWATAVVVWGYAAYKYDATAADISLFGIAFTVPGVLLGPISGTVIDRIGPKRHPGARQGARASSPRWRCSTANDFRTLALLCGLHGIAGAFSLPALQSLPPRLVDEPNLARTNALVSLTDELAIIVGPVVAGVGIALFGFKGAFVVDAAHLRARPARAPHGPPARCRSPTTAADGDDEPRPSGSATPSRAGSWSPAPACCDASSAAPPRSTSSTAPPCWPSRSTSATCSNDPRAVFAALQTVFGICLVAGGLVAARVGERLRVVRLDRGRRRRLRADRHRLPRHAVRGASRSSASPSGAWPPR